MTSPERISALVESVQFIVKNGIPRSIVECGVWRGGSMMAVALALKQAGGRSRHTPPFRYLRGPKPTEADVDLKGHSANTFFRKLQTGPDTSIIAMPPWKKFSWE